MLNALHPLVRFLIYAALLYLLWFLVYDLGIKPYTRFDLMVTLNMIYVSDFLLSLMGYDVVTENRTITLLGTVGLFVGAACNGVPLFALFSGFIIAFPGSIARKLYFIPIVILLIHALNIIRVTALCLIQLAAPHLLEFNHTYTFTILIYGFIFFLWMVWVNSYRKSLTRTGSSNPEAKTLNQA